MRMIRDELWELRRLRLVTAEQFSKAADLLAKACRGTSTRHATDMGGTGRCPVADFSLAYAAARDSAEHSKTAADAIWRRVSREVQTLPDLDTREVFSAYYNDAMTWDEVRRAVKRSESSIWRMHRDGLRKLEQ